LTHESLTCRSSSTLRISANRADPQFDPKTLTSPHAQSYGEFGWSVAMSSTIVVVVGAIEEAVSGHNGAGHVYLFSATGSLIKTLPSPNVQTGGFFGFSLAIGGTTIVVGADEETVSGHYAAGHAFIF
jgi:hypothetical protein